MQVIFFVSECSKHSTVCRFFASERGQITTQFSVMNPNLASIMQFADVSFALLQKMCDDKFSCNELSCILPCSAQVLAAKCCNCTEHFCANTAGRQTTKILRARTHADVFTQGCLYTLSQRCFSQRQFSQKTFTHTGASTQECFLSEAYLYAQVLLNRDAFTQRSFHTQTRRYFYTQMRLLHVPNWNLSQLLR